MEFSDEILRQLMDTFRVEAVDYVKTMNESLLEMERAETDAQWQEPLNAAMRAAHSLKGAARAVNLLTVEDITHRMESVMQAGRDDVNILTPDAYDALYAALDMVEQLIAGAEADASPIIAHLARLIDAPHGGASQPEPDGRRSTAEKLDTKHAPGPLSVEDTIRVKTNKLDELMAQVGSLVAIRIGGEERLEATHQLSRRMARWPKLWREIKLLLPQIHDNTGKQLSDLLYDYADHMKEMQSTFDQFEREMRLDARRLDIALNTLQDNVRRVRMVPFQTISHSLERAVRDTARAEQKELDFTIEGGEVELDKKILEALKDPLLHLLRNAVAHGIEAPSKRMTLGKNPVGRVELRLSQRGNEVQIVVEDDGQGFDIEKLRAAPHHNGYTNGSDLENQDDPIALAFMPGVSTASEVTEISGRGVGLDVVRQHIEAVRGRIQVANRPGHGVTIRLTMPTSLAITRVLMVRVGSERYGLPLLSIEKIVKPRNITILSGKTQLEVDGARLPFCPLASVIERPLHEANLAEQFALVLTVGDRRVALLVDDILTELELAVKPLAHPLVQVRNVIGTALLGSGEPVIILNPNDIINTTSRHTYQVKDALPQEATAQAARIEILVVDDSITTRTLEKNILEMAGYNVTTATNGREALKKLEAHAFDIVISDVQMPQMDGIELVSTIRTDNRFQMLPLILVTSLESPADRERGLSAGANAYIVKRGFNQEELLKTIQQFV